MTNSDFLECSGSHGTTRTRHLGIQRNGFKASPGYRGTGVYFWEKNKYARGLAIGWYINAMRRGEYSKDKDKRCSVIWATLAANRNEVVDCTIPEWRDLIFELIDKLDCIDAKGEAYKLYDELIAIAQKILGNTIKIVIAMVNPPNKPKYYPTQIYGMAWCYVAIDVGCINVESCEIIEDFDHADNASCLVEIEKGRELY